MKCLELFWVPQKCSTGSVRCYKSFVISMFVAYHSGLQALYHVFRLTNSSDMFCIFTTAKACLQNLCLCSCWIQTLLLISFHFAYFLMAFIQFKIFSCFLYNHVTFLVATSLQTLLSVPDLFVSKLYSGEQTFLKMVQ